MFGYHKETNTWRAAAHNQRDIARELLVYGGVHSADASKTWEMQVEAGNDAGLVTDTTLVDVKAGSANYLRLVERILNEFGYRYPAEPETTSNPQETQ